MKPIEIIDDEKNSRFTALVDGGQATLLYRINGDRMMEIYSTQVPSEARGQGIADKLVQAALDFAQRRSLKVVPSCSYVRRWFENHPERKDLLC